MFDVDTTEGKADLYLRSGLAGSICKALRNPVGGGSMVVALDGAWGSGKSWLLDEIERRVNIVSKGTPIRVFRFNPWLVGEESDLILEFLMQIALELSSSERNQKAAKTAGRTLLKYAKGLSYGRYLKYVPIPGIDKIGEAIGDVTDSTEKAVEAAGKALAEEARPSLNSARMEAKAAIRTLGERLIVLIDDIDRLRPREIRAVMQLVKSVADFPNTSFLLAFDFEIVASALHQSESAGSGPLYLEKILQLTIPVPEVDRALIRRDVDRRLEEVRQINSYAIRPYERAILDDALRLVAALCLVPRDVVRWANQLAWTVSNLAGSVNLADLCVVEALRLKAPRSSWTALAKSAMVQPAGQLYDTDLPNWLVWAGMQDENRERERERLAVMFPTQAGHAAATFLLPNLVKDAKRLANPQERRRLSSSVVWQHYVRFATGSPSVTGATIDEWLQNPTALDSVLGNSRKDMSEQELDSLLQIGGFILFDTLPPGSRHVPPLVRAIKRFAANNELRSAGFSSTNVASLIEELLLSPELGQDPLLQLVSDLPLFELTIALERIEEVSKSAYEWPERREAAEAALSVVRGPVVDRVTGAFRDRSILREGGRITLAHSISRLASPERAAGLLAPVIASDEDLLKFLSELNDRTAEFLASPPLVSIHPDPRAFIERLRTLARPELSGFTEVLGRLPSEFLDRVEQYFAIALRPELDRKN